MRRILHVLTFLALAAPAGAQAATVTQVEAVGASFPVVETGAGEPVLFVHGSFADHRAWEPIRDAAAADHRFIAYTQRHFGTAAWPEEPVFARDVHEADLTALLDHWGEPMHLVGWSSSGPTVLRAALDRPDLVQRVAIFEPALDTVLKGKADHEQVLADWMAGWGPTVEAVQGGDHEQAARLALEYVFGMPDGGFETLPEDARTMFRENSHTVASEFAAPVPTPVTCDDLRAIEAPVLILYGSDTLPFFAAAAKEVAACLPNATLEEVPGAGHGGPLQQSDAVIERVLAFIDAEGA